MCVYVQRPTAREWQQHVRAVHGGLLTALTHLAGRLAERHIDREHMRPPSQRAPCPFGCTCLDDGGANDGPAARPDGTTSLADRMLPLALPSPMGTHDSLVTGRWGVMRPELTGATAAAAGGPPPVSSAAASARASARTRLFAHLARFHLPEMQFMLSYAHELAAVACTPAAATSAKIQLPTDGYLDAAKNATDQVATDHRLNHDHNASADAVPHTILLHMDGSGTRPGRAADSRSGGDVTVLRSGARAIGIGCPFHMRARTVTCACLPHDPLLQGPVEAATTAGTDMLKVKGA